MIPVTVDRIKYFEKIMEERYMQKGIALILFPDGTSVSSDVEAYCKKKNIKIRVTSLPPSDQNDTAYILKSEYYQ